MGAAFLRCQEPPLNRQLFHIKAGLLQILNGVFSFGVRFVNRHDAIVFGHGCPFGSLFISAPRFLLL